MMCVRVRNHHHPKRGDAVWYLQWGTRCCVCVLKLFKYAECLQRMSACLLLTRLNTTCSFNATLNRGERESSIHTMLVSNYTP